MAAIWPRGTRAWGLMRVRILGGASERPDGGGAAACGNDAGQTVVLEPLPSGLKLRHQRVSPDGHGVRLGWHPALSRAVAP